MFNYHLVPTYSLLSKLVKGEEVLKTEVHYEVKSVKNSFRRRYWNYWDLKGTKVSGLKS